MGHFYINMVSPTWPVAHSLREFIFVDSITKAGTPHIINYKIFLKSKNINLETVRK